MGAKVTICCCHYHLKHSREEKHAILRMRKTTASSESSDSDTEEKSIFGETPSKRSPWDKQQRQRTTADRDLAVRRGSDRELQAFISMRDQADKATEEWEKLNYDIHALCYARREVRSRWKKILLQLGYQREADALLHVHRQIRPGPDQEQLNRASDLLKQLLDHTSLFPPGTGPQNRYLHVMDRLVSLDSAEEFIRLAKEKYPKK
ncbi:melanoregulin-like [Betta splendens]|uniref:Melanoregulin-like n=1 Tax=Betta splendens TaxID=158456 RepID=A0A9W2XHR9_BETSP|nr:melanoregulin-like [Betta splendens]XP_055361285.1 melanoregulin-like [Betta splendens]